VAASPVVFTATCNVAGVLPLVGVTESQLPVELALAVKAIVPLAPATERVWLAGLAPPAVPLKLRDEGVTESVGCADTVSATV
jgi:hypothetical protein